MAWHALCELKTGLQRPHLQHMTKKSRPVLNIDSQKVPLFDLNGRSLIIVQ